MADSEIIDLEEDTSLHSDLIRRVHNFALGPTTPSNALVPMFEAIYNAIHAIQDKFESNWADQSRIDVALITEQEDGLSIEVRDNGIGLTPANFRSFRTYDSGLKAKRGGKGVGRLSWLKVFDHAEVTSVFEHEGVFLRRVFWLTLDNTQPIKNHRITRSEFSKSGTTVVLRRMRPEYARHVPTKTDTVLRKVVAHFLPYLVGSDRPSIFLETDNESHDLVDFLGTKEVNLGSADLDLPNNESAHIEHNLLERGVMEGDATHKFYIAANGRVVSEHDIGGALGLKTYIERDGNRYVYAGVVSGDAFDKSVNVERTAFDINTEVIEAVTRSALSKVKDILAPQINRVIDKQAELMKNVVKRYPRFAYMVENPRDFVVNRVPRNMRSAEQIYQQLAIYDYRENRDIERRVEVLSKADNDDEDVIKSGVESIIGKLTNQEFSVLADYTVRRKVILDLLERRLGFKPDGSMKHNSEAALHSFVVPMQVGNNDVHVEKHNLWILDDKLTYYEHWASDKQIKKLVAESDSQSRPDVLLFGGRTAYHRPGTDQPVVLIEFKKPVRNDYSEEENPFTQIYGYIEELRKERF
ncbi:ATP-binding protein [Stakelama pacifica]|uniref:Histidine kinase/DNA gyrase B/HSP90-like ATPase n=1 Tax=Stakelama pacifica TaxID=517720 RepID=A0A4R6FCB2_9SPHN|nr:ATP-binding protein [Stakelama pacifica]TDN77894.1 histidine kinase/DNA gyrase B/HSP90-like ATPase [Stakelama pacifica]GGP00626.1 hypothetical protein GCM10011329_36950 [Stakelama pacifica]